MFTYSPISASRVQDRHNTINPVIGSFPEEREAYTLLTLLSYYLPLGLLVTSFLDLSIVWTYMSWYHPWKHILTFMVKDWHSTDALESFLPGGWW